MVAASFDKAPKHDAGTSVPASSASADRAGLPGHEFEQKAAWHEILKPHGWTLVKDKSRHGIERWARPGKNPREGHSATVGAVGDNLYVFSSSAYPLDEGHYTKFRAYTFLNHGGDFNAAAKDLAKQGYGEPMEALRVVEDQEEYTDDMDMLNKLAPSFASLYGRKQLEEAKDRECLELAFLPGFDPECQSFKGKSDWIDSGRIYKHGHGWGEQMDRQIQLSPGSLVAVGASYAGAGKTSFVMQIVEGLAFRSAELVRNGNPKKKPLTPVLYMTEMGHEELGYRSTSRLTGANNNTFRNGATSKKYWYQGEKEELFNHFWDRAMELSEGDNIYADGRREFLKPYLDPVAPNGKQGPRGADLAARICHLANTWKKHLEDKYDAPVWPIIVIDPIHRFIDSTKGEIEGLGELSACLIADIKKNGFIGFVTADTNKMSTQQDVEKGQGEGIFRGSQQFIHAVDYAFYLSSDPCDSPGPREKWTKDVWLHFTKNRWGSGKKVGFEWTVNNGRFRPKDTSEEEIE
jgi:hypothetical protein